MSHHISKERSRISAMFNGIAASYDFLNHLLSLGIDKYWRRVLIREIKAKDPEKALDIATGTGDIAISLYKAGISVTGADIAEKMVDIAREKCNKLVESTTPIPVFHIASADDLPYESQSFQLVTIGFGIRNFENREGALQEIYRVLTPGGELAILEFAEPENRIWRGLYRFYFHNILPILGRLISKDMEAYAYLPESVNEFPKYKNFCNELENAGFKNAKYRSLTGGITLLYTAVKS